MSTQSGRYEEYASIHTLESLVGAGEGAGKGVGLPQPPTTLSGQQLKNVQLGVNYFILLLRMFFFPVFMSTM